MDGQDSRPSFLRLDRLLADLTDSSRKDVKEWIRKGRVTVDTVIVRQADAKVPSTSRIFLDGKPLKGIRDYVYYLLNKPAGYLSATEDRKAPTVLDLVPASRRRKLSPVGRLDKDTEGLLIITDDGAFAHQLLSPRSHVDKVYLADVQGIMTGEDAARIAQGIDIGEEKPAMPARLEILETDEKQGTCRIRLTLQEGKYHQVKRMVAACGKEVIYLKRVRMGVLELPEDLPAGQWRQISREDVLGV